MNDPIETLEAARAQVVQASHELCSHLGISAPVADLLMQDRGREALAATIEEVGDLESWMWLALVMQALEMRRQRDTATGGEA
jgi:hypothetical protein